MGIYLNATSAYGLFQEEFSLTYFVDKTEILNELVSLVEQKIVLVSDSVENEYIDNPR